MGEGVKTVNTFGLMKVESDVINTIAAVPWCALSPSEERDISLANLIKTATLEENDHVLVYSDEDGLYRAWCWADGRLSPVVTCSGLSTLTQPGAAAETTVPCGSGVMIVRQHPDRPFYLFGQQPSAPATSVVVKAESQDEPTHQLLAPIGFQDYDVQDIQPVAGSVAATASPKVCYDQIFIMGNGAEPTMYTYKDGKWGYDERYAESLQGITFYRTRRVTELPKIKAGTGFWYVSRGGDPSFVWPVAGKEVH